MSPLRFAPVEMTIHFEGDIRSSRKRTKAFLQQTCRLDRSEAEWRHLRFSYEVADSAASTVS
jgi:hypothetical protein